MYFKEGKKCIEKYVKIQTRALSSYCKRRHIANHLQPKASSEYEEVAGFTTSCNKDDMHWFYFTRLLQ